MEIKNWNLRQLNIERNQAFDALDKLNVAGGNLTERIAALAANADVASEAVKGLETANADLLAANESLKLVEEQNAKLTEENAKLKATASDSSSNIALLAKACVEAGCVEVVGENEAQKIEAAEKLGFVSLFDSFKTSVTRAAAKVGVQIKDAPAQSPVGSKEAKTLSRAEFSKLSPRSQMDFAKSGGKLTE